MTPSCPICHRALPAPDQNPTHPFCSARCKLIDLGNWLDGAYRIAGPSAFVENDAAFAENADGENAPS
ncbi:DNA gyrase inhibitor YacG [Sandaracinus amylolyticus]|uniref:DNA gyrase inhibitor YacG n=1 Tax=Sandaracinus amylolyticus TaxID=927083 RepID=UPI001F21E816|nr:DNA gyrase inhibitor YacG [Sandaracinus amylolyticus]UJR81616.1 DNA gyrase inhibitor YacG [Sandaracinus amylolyticus]